MNTVGIYEYAQSAVTRRDPSPNGIVELGLYMTQMH